MGDTPSKIMDDTINGAAIRESNPARAFSKSELREALTLIGRIREAEDLVRRVLDDGVLIDLFFVAAHRVVELERLNEELDRLVTRQRDLLQEDERRANGMAEEIKQSHMHNAKLEDKIHVVTGQKDEKLRRAYGELNMLRIRKTELEQLIPQVAGYSLRYGQMYSERKLQGDGLFQSIMAMADLPVTPESVDKFKGAKAQESQGTERGYTIEREGKSDES